MGSWDTGHLFLHPDTLCVYVWCAGNLCVCLFRYMDTRNTSFYQEGFFLPGYFVKLLIACRTAEQPVMLGT